MGGETATGGQGLETGVCKWEESDKVGGVSVAPLSLRWRSSFLFC
jgi:hypothetical protein